MKNTIKMIGLLFLFTTTFVTTACTNEAEPEKTNDNFLEGKLDTIKKSEAVDQLIQDTAAMQRRMIDEQSE